MKNNKLILYKENIFTKISNFFKNLFFRKRQQLLEKTNYTPNEAPSKYAFLSNIKVEENSEEKRLKALKLQYDNGQIDEEDITEEDMDKLIAMYEKETEELNLDTERRKNHIAQMFKELKN